MPPGSRITEGEADCPRPEVSAYLDGPPGSRSSMVECKDRWPGRMTTTPSDYSSVRPGRRCELTIGAGVYSAPTQIQGPGFGQPRPAFPKSQTGRGPAADSIRQ